MLSAQLDHLLDIDVVALDDCRLHLLDAELETADLGNERLFRLGQMTAKLGAVGLHEVFKPLLSTAPNTDGPNGAPTTVSAGFDFGCRGHDV
jgi:hypothetical protein